MKVEKLSIEISDSIGAVSAEITADAGMDFLYVLAHGAGAGMDHPFMVRLSAALAILNIGSLRFNFPFVEKGGKRPDAPAVAEKTIRMAISAASERFPATPLLAGGKSFGGRMTSQALSRGAETQVKGIVFVGFPLHAPGNAGTARADHLRAVPVPMLFLQGSRDALADIQLIEQVSSNLPLATLKRFEGADHSFKAGKQDLIMPLAEAIRHWSSNLR